MASLYALDFGPIRDMAEMWNRKEEFNRQQQLLWAKNKLAEDENARAAALHPYALAAGEQAKSLYPLETRVKKVGAEAAEEDRFMTNQYRIEQGFAVPKSVARLPTIGAAAPAASTGASVEKPAQAYKFLNDYVLNGGDQGERNWHAFVASHPDIYNGLHADGFVANGKSWQENSTNLMRAIQKLLPGSAPVAATPQPAPAQTTGEPGSSPANYVYSPTPQAAAQVSPDTYYHTPETVKGNLPPILKPAATPQAPAAAPPPANRPLFDSIGGAMKATERLGAVPGMAGTAEAKFKTLQGIVEKGYMPTLPGSRDQVMPLSGSAESQARAKQLEHAATKYGEALGTREAENIPLAGTTVGKIHQGLLELSSIPQRYGGDKGVFTSAVGPFAGDPSLISNPLGPVARTWGSLTSGGAAGANKNAPPSEVRRAIEGGVETLTAILKPLIRKPGEGTWSDADQAKLNAIVGNLTQVKDEAQYWRELDNVRQRLNANFNMGLPPIPAPESVQKQSAPPPPRPPSLPEGALYSASRRMWRVGDKMFNEDGSPVAGQP